jgi:aminoglycoside phosphotransferase (APT) family kinase protein
MSLSPGTRLGSFEVLSLLGSGGMGEVYRARDRRLGRAVALKVLRPELARDAERLNRFEQEARSASALNHPSVVHIYDIGEQDGLRFIAMELVEGRTLRRLLAEGRPGEEEVLRLGVQIAEGLAKAHASGIVHRDLKPENLMVTPDGFVKILDFGLAKLAPAPLAGCSDLTTIAELSTRPGMLVGTVEYMAPEQARGALVDFRADQFSLGLVLYEMATGRMAFRRASPVETLAAILEREPEPMSSLNPAVPPGLEAIVGRCLRKDPAERYPSTGDLAQALRAVRDSLGARALVPPAAPAPARAVPAVPARHYYVQIEDRVKRLSEARLRRLLRHDSLTGLELVRREGEERWEPLHQSEVFREEVPAGQDPRAAARRRALRGFGGHLTGFLVTTIVMLSQQGDFPFWLGIWGIFLLSHGLRVLPSAIAFLREHRPPGGREPAPRELTVRERLAAPAPLPASLLEEVARVRALLERRGGRDGKGNLSELERLVALMEGLAAKRADLAEQTSEREREELERSERETLARLEKTELVQDRQLLERQLGVLRERRKAIDKAIRLGDRLRVRLTMAEHQIKQLRLDLTRAEASRLEVPELSSRLQFIRHEVDAAEEVDELLAGG